MVFDVSKSEPEIGVFEILKMFYPQRDCESRTEGGSIVFIYVFSWEESEALRLGDHLILLYFIFCIYLYPPKGAAKAEPVLGPIVFIYILSSEGSCESSNRRWSNYFYLVLFLG